MKIPLNERRPQSELKPSGVPAAAASLAESRKAARKMAHQYKNKIDLREKAPQKEDFAKISPEAIELFQEWKKKALEKNQLVEEKRSQELKKEHPALFFISGFDYLGFSRSSADGLKDLAQSTEYGKHFTWNQKEDILKELKKFSADAPVVLVGHSLGGDTAVEVANSLNSPEHQFRKIKLLVTIDSFGLDNDILPQNIGKSLNFISDKDGWLNDEAHVARNFHMTEVINELRPETHRELDNSQEVQMKIMNSIKEMVGSKSMGEGLNKT